MTSAHDIGSPPASAQRRCRGHPGASLARDLGTPGHGGRRNDLSQLRRAGRAGLEQRLLRPGDGRVHRRRSRQDHAVPDGADDIRIRGDLGRFLSSARPASMLVLSHSSGRGDRDRRGPPALSPPEATRLGQTGSSHRGYDRRSPLCPSEADPRGRPSWRNTQLPATPEEAGAMTVGMRKQGLADMLEGKLEQGYGIEDRTDTGATLVSRGRRRRQWFGEAAGGGSSGKASPSPLTAGQPSEPLR